MLYNLLNKKIKSKDGERILEIRQSEYPESPREFSNISKMICFHWNYNLGDNHNIDHSDFDWWDEMENYIIKNKKPYIIKPLYLYDHSGITISTTPFQSKWDSGQIGFVYSNKETVKEIYPEWENISKKRKEKLEKHINKEIELYDDYIKGNVFEFVIKDKNWDLIDRVGWFIGDDLENNGLMGYLKDVNKELAQKLKSKL